MLRKSASIMQLSVHGIAVGIENNVPAMESQIRQIVDPFAVTSWPGGFQPAEGVLSPYNEADVMRHLSPTATPLSVPGDPMELYGEDERFWLIDDHWGLCEINLLKNRWRSWVIPNPSVDPFCCVERAVLWPMAQLLRGRGITLVPATSVARGQWGMLIVSPFGIEPELNGLIHAGFKIIGQRWTALRDEPDGRVGMLSIPGMVERNPPPRPRALSGIRGAHWTDLTAEFCGSQQNHAFCDTVLLVEPGRRTSFSVRPVGKVAALPTIRKNWPIIDLHPHWRAGQMQARIARSCQCFETCLSRKPSDLLDHLKLLREGRPSMAIRPERPTLQSLAG